VFHLYTQTHLKSSNSFFVFVLFLSFPFPRVMILPIFSQKQSSRLLHFSTRHCSRFFFLYMYLSLDPFTQLSIYIYRSSFPLTYPMSLSPFQSQCITALASNTNSTFHSHRCTTTTAVQLQVCIYEISYSAAVNNRLHVLFLM